MKEERRGRCRRGTLQTYRSAGRASNHRSDERDLLAQNPSRKRTSGPKSAPRARLGAMISCTDHQNSLALPVNAARSEQSSVILGKQRQASSRLLNQRAPRTSLPSSSISHPRFSPHAQRIHRPLFSTTLNSPFPTPPNKSIKMTGGKSGGKASGTKSSAQR